MRANFTLDSVDRQILGVLQKDTTVSNKEIAEQVGLSTNPCWRRIQRLQEAGVIKRRVAVLDAKKLGLGTTAFVLVKTGQHDKAWLETFANGVRRIPEITECHRTSGSVDYLLKIVVRDIEHYDEVYQSLIRYVPGISDVTSVFSMEQMKDDTALDLNTAPR